MSEENNQNLKKSELTWSSKEVSRGQCDVGSSCTSLMKAARLVDGSCVCTWVHTPRGKMEVSEVHGQLQSYFICITETRWDSSCNWKTAMDGHRPRKWRWCLLYTAAGNNCKAWTPWGNFNDLDIFWKGNTAGYEQYKRFLECVDDNCLIQDVNKPI